MPSVGSAYRLGLAPGVELEPGAETKVRGPGRALVLRADRELQGLLGRLADDGLSLAARESASDRLGLAVVLRRLDRLGWLTWSAGTPAQAVARRRGRWTRDGAPADGPVELDPRCVLAAGPQGLEATAPAHGYVVTLTGATAGELVRRAAEPGGVRPEHGADGVTTELIGLLGECGVLRTRGDAPEDPVLRYWEPHDLVLHTTSREGFADRPFGGTYRLGGAQPARLHAEPRAATIVLDRPENADGQGLFAVLDRRRSLRGSTETAMTRSQVAGLLYRSARTIAVHPAGQDEVEWRPYPSGGAIHELTVYLLVSRVRGLAPGCYRYRSREHALEAVPAGADGVRGYLEGMAWAALRDTPPDLALVVTSQLPRLAWKYEAIAYAVTLKNAGALLQTIYLVATALDLAPCAVGGGDAVDFAELCGLDPFAEPAIAEILVSARDRAETP